MALDERFLESTVLEVTFGHLPVLDNSDVRDKPVAELARITSHPIPQTKPEYRYDRVMYVFGRNADSSVIYVSSSAFELTTNNSLVTLEKKVIPVLTKDISRYTPLIPVPPARDCI